MDIEEINNAGRVSLGEHEKFVLEIPEMSDVAIVQKEEQEQTIKNENCSNSSEELDSNELCQIDTINKDDEVQKNHPEENLSPIAAVNMSEPCLINQFNQEKSVMENNYVSEVKLEDTEKAIVNNISTLSHGENKEHSESPSTDSMLDTIVPLPNSDVNLGVDKISKDFYNIEVEIARIVGEEVHEEPKIWENNDSSDNVSEVKTEKTTEIDSTVGNSTIDSLKDTLEDKELSENAIQDKSDHDTNDEEHENSIDEEEIEDYELFLYNSSIDTNVQEEEETNEVHLTEIYLSDPEDYEVQKKRRFMSSDDDNDKQYDIMQLADVSEVERLHQCSVCQYKTPHLSALRRHVSMTHSKSPWTCKYCRKKFTSRFFGEKHIQADHSRKNRKCPYCSFSGLYSGTVMQKHITLTHGFKTIEDSSNVKTLKRNSYSAIKCEHCAYSAKNRELWLTHMEMHNLKYVLRCIHCYYMINNRKMYDEHVKSTHKLAKKIFICTKCFFQSEEWEDYYSHINSRHDFHCCSKCEFKTPYIEIFYNHINSHKNDTDSESEEEVILICNKCGYKASSQDNLTCHLEAQHSENSKDEVMEGTDENELLIENLGVIDNQRNEENVIEFVELDETEENGHGMHISPNSEEQTEELMNKLEYQHLDEKDSDSRIPDLRLVKQEYIEHSDSEQERSIVKQEISGSNTAFIKCPRCSKNFAMDEFFDHLNQHCPRCKFWSDDPRVLKVHTFTHSPNSSNAACNVQQSPCYVSEKVVNDNHIFIVDTNRISKPSSNIQQTYSENQEDQNVYSPSRTVNDIEEINIDSPNVWYNPSSSGESDSDRSCDVFTDAAGFKSSLFHKRFKEDYSEDSYEKDTDQSRQIIKILKHQCFDCLMIYKTRYTLLDHRKKKHGLKKPHSCTYCMENFETYNCLKSHYYRVHRVSYHNSGAFYKCPLCDFTSTRKRIAVNHVSRHHYRKAESVDGNIDFVV